MTNQIKVAVSSDEAADVAGVDRRQISSNKTDASCICPKGRSSNRDAGGSSEARPVAPHAGTAGHRKSGRPWVSKKLPVTTRSIEFVVGEFR
jgi:hypothetical protein